MAGAGVSSREQPPSGLDGKVAIVTGGAATSAQQPTPRLRRRDSGRVRRPGRLASAVADAMVSDGGKRWQSDRCSQHCDVESMVARVIDECGVDILVNVWVVQRERATVHGRETVIGDRGGELFGVIFCSRAVVGQMIEQGGGKIVASHPLALGPARFADYAAAKAG